MDAGQSMVGSDVIEVLASVSTATLSMQLLKRGIRNAVKHGWSEATS